MKKGAKLIVGIILVIAVGSVLFGYFNERQAGKGRGFKLIEEADRGYACEYEVVGTGGKCPSDIGDTLYIYCCIGEDGRCAVGNETVKVCQEDVCYLQLKLIDSACDMRENNVYIVVGECS